MNWRNVRKYLYTLLIALGPVAAFYGFMSGEEVALWLGVGGTILAVPGSTTALANLNRPEDEAPGELFDVSERPEGPQHAA